MHRHPHHQNKFKRYGDIPVRAVATSAVREAANKDEFLRLVKEKTGLTIEVISWEQEAALTLEGALWQLDDLEQNILTFDIGGGSTEYIFSRGKRVLGFEGTSLGVVRAVVDAVGRPVDVEVVEVAVEPHERSLDVLVQVGQSRVAEDFESSPDRRLDVLEADFQAVDGVRCGHRLMARRRKMGRSSSAYGGSVGTTSTSRFDYGATSVTKRKTHV